MKTIIGKLTLEEIEILKNKLVETYLKGANDILDGLIEIFESESRDFSPTEIIECFAVVKSQLSHKLPLKGV